MLPRAEGLTDWFPQTTSQKSECLAMIWAEKTQVNSLKAQIVHGNENGARLVDLPWMSPDPQIFNENQSPLGFAEYPYLGHILVYFPGCPGDISRLQSQIDTRF